LPAGSQGGAVYIINATSLAVEQSRFVNNTALTGGGIYMSRVTDTYIYDTLFYSNNVTQEGGGIYSGMPPLHVALHVLFSMLLQIMKFAEHVASSLPLMDICKLFRHGLCTIAKQLPVHGVCCCTAVMSALVNVSCTCEALKQHQGFIPCGSQLLQPPTLLKHTYLAQHFQIMAACTLHDGYLVQFNI